VIVDQGEGARGDWRTAHFGRFYGVLREYLEMRDQDPGFKPTRPVLVADVRPGEHGEIGDLIGDPTTALVVDLFNVTYEVMLQVLARYFTHTDESSDQLSVLAEVALALMVQIMKPLGELIPDLPVGPKHPGRTAGPSFELFYTSGYHLPHQHAAWRLLRERLQLAARLARDINLADIRGVGVLADAATRLDRLAQRLALASDDATPPVDSSPDAAHVRITENGPYVVTGGLPLSEMAIGSDSDGSSVSWEQRAQIPTDARYALCRCGRSSNKPFCDGTHARVGFDGTETASRRPFTEDAEVIDGPTMTLADDRPLCAFARFCDGHGGIWALTPQATDVQTRTIITAQATACPSGRLVLTDKLGDGTVLEPELDRSIVLIEDPAQDASGPIWVRGGVRLTSADGHVYETRNRVTLCRCGQSTNKPFCDGTHAHIGFQAHTKDDK
jgi:CDGSH-type Zn-finger protein